MTPARNIGIFYDLPSGQIKYIMNPDFEEEIDGHVLGAGEAVVKLPKALAGVYFAPDSMTLGQVQQLLALPLDRLQALVASAATSVLTPTVTPPVSVDPVTVADPSVVAEPPVVG